MKYHVSIGNNNSFHGLERSEFEVGETVEFKVPFVRDCNTSVTSGDVTLNRMDKSDDDYYFYFFVMPEHDVTVNVSSVGNMANSGSPMSFMNSFSGMNMNQFQNMMQANALGNSNGGAKRKLFCASCGTKLGTEGQKFCTECGAKQE